MNASSLFSTLESCPTKNLLFTPYADEWKLEESDNKTAAELFAQDYKKKRKRNATTPSKLLLFLYAKGTLAEEDSVIRKRKFGSVFAAGQGKHWNDLDNC